MKQHTGNAKPGGSGKGQTIKTPQTKSTARPVGGSRAKSASGSMRGRVNKR